MEVTFFLKEIYRIGKRLGDLRLFEEAQSLNSTEMQMVREIIVAKETGNRVISSQLAKKLGVTRSAVSQMVHKLEKNNIVRRVPDVKDKKIAYIELSEFACGIYEQMKQKFAFFLDRVTEKLGEQRMEEFLDRANEFLDACESVSGSIFGREARLQENG